MPTPLEILEGLAEITQRWRMLAITWHVYFGVMGIGLLFDVRPTKLVAGILLAIPLFSVSVLAWLTGNPFNGTVFALVGVGLIGIAFTLPREPISIGPIWTVVAGVIMFAFGWAYPHFLQVSSPLEYLYAAPTGLIPCPTLSIVIGFALIVGGFESRLWSIVLGLAGLFYGAFGAFRLGVTIDLVLLVGSLALLAEVLIPGFLAGADSSSGEPTLGGPQKVV